MNTKKCLKYALCLVVSAFACQGFTSCSEDIEMPAKIDEQAYGAIYRIDGMLLDRNTGKNLSEVVLTGDELKLNVFFQLTKLPQKGVDVKLELDPTYQEIYNAANDKDYPLYPAEYISIGLDGKLTLAPDDVNSPGVDIILTGGETLEQDKVYMVPLKVTPQTNGITIPEETQHAVYLVTNKWRKPTVPSQGGDADDGRVKLVMYMEVNDENPLNILEFKLKDSGKMLFDQLVIFSANINEENGKPKVHLNAQVTELLNRSDELLQPLRQAGIKVILSILGNHDQAGVAKLTDTGAKYYAQKLKEICDTYQLDGVTFDDEYTRGGGGNEYIAGSSNAKSAARLLYECKKAMPDKIVTFYELGQLRYDRLNEVKIVDEGVEYPFGSFVDYYVGDYGYATQPLSGMTLRNCSGLSHQLGVGWLGDMISQSKKVKDVGYGYMMLYAIQTKNYSYALTLLNEVAIGLYDEEMAMPKYYYKQKNQYPGAGLSSYYDAKAYPISELGELNTWSRPK